MVRRGERDKRGQLKMSFGMIFSIILIIIFIAFAVFGILKFIEINGKMKAGRIMDNLQADLDNMWRSSKGSQKVSYYTPKSLEAICFDYQTDASEDPNMYFIPEDLGGKDLLHINWETTQPSKERPKCFEPNNVTHKIELLLKKDYGELEVTITDPPEPVPTPVA